MPLANVAWLMSVITRATCGGVLHWIVTPFNTEGKPPTYGAGGNALLNFVPTGSQPPGTECKATQPGSAPTGRNGGRWLRAWCPWGRRDRWRRSGGNVQAW